MKFNTYKKIYELANASGSYDSFKKNFLSSESFEFITTDKQLKSLYDFTREDFRQMKARLKMTQEEIANYLCVSKPAVNAWSMENNGKELPEDKKKVYGYLLWTEFLENRG